MPSAEVPGTGPLPQVPGGRLLGQRIGFLSLPTTEKIPGYARAGARAVRTVDASGPCGWIVDLRGDSGGAVWPMLDVLAPWPSPTATWSAARAIRPSSPPEMAGVPARLPAVTVSGGVDRA